MHVLPDAAKVVLAFLRPLIAERDEPFLGGIKIGRTVKPSVGPCIQVRPVAGRRYSPAHSRPQVDFLFWHNSPSDAMAAALVVQALCYAAAGDATPAGRITYSDELMAPIEMIDPVDGDTPQVMFRHEFYIR